MKRKETSVQTKDASTVSSPPLTKPEFESFLRKVTRPVQKSLSEKEKPQT